MLSFLIFLCLVGLLHANKKPTSGPVSIQSVSSGKLWAIPSHLTVVRDTGEESLHSLSDNQSEDGKSEIDGISGTSIFLRALYLLCIFFPVYTTAIWAYLFSWFRPVWFQLLFMAVENSGAAFIKWGQWSSTRPDMFPPELCTVLANLQSSAPVHSWSYTKELVKQELGSPIEDVFHLFEETPIASGSIAQVYRAILNGVEVAVKVRHPNVKEHITMDFYLMNLLAAMVERIPGLSWLNLKESLSQFSGTIASQTRLDVEGWHLHLFTKNFKRWKDVDFPKPIIITQGVLVESFEHGKTVSCYTNAKDASIPGNRCGDTITTFASGNEMSIKLKQLTLAHFIVCRGEDLYLKMLIQDNLMHADLHPGNILIQNIREEENRTLGNANQVKELMNEAVEAVSSVVETKNDEEEQMMKQMLSGDKIVLVDAGMVTRLRPEEQKNFIGFLSALGEGNGEESADFVIAFSPNKIYSDNQKEGFRKGMELLFAEKCKGYGTGIDLGEVLRGVLGLCRIYEITVNANYATLIMNAMCLDGLATQLMPSYNIMDGAKLFLRFHRTCTRWHCLPVIKFLLPLARLIKRHSDNQFLRQAKKRL